MIITIQIGFDLTEPRSYFSVCARRQKLSAFFNAWKEVEKWGGHFGLISQCLQSCVVNTRNKNLQKSVPYCSMVPVPCCDVLFKLLGTILQWWCSVPYRASKRSNFCSGFRSTFGCCQIAAIRLTAVRETGVSRHHGHPIEDLLVTPRTMTTLLYLVV